MPVHQLPTMTLHDIWLVRGYYKYSVVQCNYRNFIESIESRTRSILGSITNGPCTVFLMVPAVVNCLMILASESTILFTLFFASTKKIVMISFSSCVKHRAVPRDGEQWFIYCWRGECGYGITIVVLLYTENFFYNYEFTIESKINFNKRFILITKKKKLYKYAIAGEVYKKKKIVSFKKIYHGQRSKHINPHPTIRLVTIDPMNE